MEKKWYVTASEMQEDLGVSKSKAYEIIKELNERLKKEHPGALVINGRANRRYYEEACLIREK